MTTSPLAAPSTVPAPPKGATAVSLPVRGPAVAFRNLLLRARQAPRGAEGREGQAVTILLPRTGTPRPALPGRGGKEGHDAGGIEGAGHAKVTTKGHGHDEKSDKRGPHDDALDPAARHAAQLAPPMMMHAGPPELTLGGSAPEVHARASLETLLPALVKKIAWAGDGRRGSVRMELGSGALAGGTVLVHADGGRVRVELDAPPGADREAWKKRITDRLTESGLDVEHVEVT